MTNENCLDGIKCPACGTEDTFRIEVTTMATVTDDGAEVDHGDMDWDETSYAECANCHQHGKLSHFKALSEAPHESSPPQPKLLAALASLLSSIDEDVPLETVSRHFREAVAEVRVVIAEAKGRRPA
jgi:hypothetical protein